MGKPKIKQMMEQHVEICPKCDRKMHRVDDAYKCVACGFIKAKRGTAITPGQFRQDKKSGLFLP